jgi:hypothetical protein
MSEEQMTGQKGHSEDEQVEKFERLCRRVGTVLNGFGRPDTLERSGDHSVYDSYWGFPQVKVTLANLALLEPRVVHRLQSVLKAFPGWEIVVAVAVEGHYDDWPDMGLIIRAHEIIDGLQRQYFPPAYRGLIYEGSRPGADRD